MQVASQGLGRSGRRARERYPRARQSRVVGDWEMKYRFLPRRDWSGSRNEVANASSLICAAFSGFCDSREDMVVRGLRRLGGMTPSLFWESLEALGSESMSRDERPRWEVLDLAAERIEDSVMYGRGKG
jgi:hypothetical protein